MSFYDWKTEADENNGVIDRKLALRMVMFAESVLEKPEHNTELFLHERECGDHNSYEYQDVVDWLFEHGCDVSVFH